MQLNNNLTMQFRLLFISLLAFSTTLRAQEIVVSSGTTLQISSNQKFHVSGLTLTPSAAFDMDGLSITKKDIITNPSTSGDTSISRHYLFNTTSPSYSGTIQVNYLDAELNGISESDLEVNYHNGTDWQQIATASNDATNNYVVSNAISGKLLQEITVAASSGPLPVTWLDFTATKQGESVALDWSTAQEINTLDFIVQHSIDGQLFEHLLSQPAAGNSVSESYYSAMHTRPIQGNNYYRIMQRDIDGAIDYSDVRLVVFGPRNPFAEDLFILGNPIVGQTLNLKSTINQTIHLYTMVGSLCWSKQLTMGQQNIDVTDLPKGTYLLRTSQASYRIIKL